MKDKAPPKAAPAAARSAVPAGRVDTPDPARPPAERVAKAAKQPTAPALVAAQSPAAAKTPTAVTTPTAAGKVRAPAAQEKVAGLPALLPEDALSRTVDAAGPPPLGAPWGASDGLAEALAAATPGADRHDELPSRPGVPLAPPGIVPESDVRTHSPGAATPPREEGPAGYQEGLGELPQGYADGRLVSLIRDPTTLFIYWDLGPPQIEQAFAGLGASRAVLRLWNARSNRAELVREVEVSLEARGWYLRDLPGGIELRVELWAIGERGARMLRAARPGKLPPAAPSDVLEEFYANLTLDTPLPKDGKLSAGSPLAWVSGGAPTGWERRLQPLLGGGPIPTNRPWSMTHLRDLDDPDDSPGGATDRGQGEGDRRGGAATDRGPLGGDDQ